MWMNLYLSLERFMHFGGTSAFCKTPFVSCVLTGHLCLPLSVQLQDAAPGVRASTLPRLGCRQRKGWKTCVCFIERYKSRTTWERHWDTL